MGSQNFETGIFAPGSRLNPNYDNEQVGFASTESVEQGLIGLEEQAKKLTGWLMYEETLVKCYDL